MRVGLDFSGMWWSLLSTKRVRMGIVTRGGLDDARDGLGLRLFHFLV